jgi:hypothetical protein
VSRWLLALPLAVFGVGGIGLYALFQAHADEASFRDNLLPELIGFCLEGFFLVGLFSFVQQLREIQRRRELWLNLRSALRDFLSQLDLAYLPANGEPAGMRELETRPDVVPRLLARLEAEQLDIDHLVALKRIAVATLPLSRDLINIAAQLSTRHMRCWIAIVAAINRLTEADSREQIEHPLHEMLTRLVEFDGLQH